MNISSNVPVGLVILGLLSFVFWLATVVAFIVTMCSRVSDYQDRDPPVRMNKRDPSSRSTHANWPNIRMDHHCKFLLMRWISIHGDCLSFDLAKVK